MDVTVAVVASGDVDSAVNVVGVNIGVGVDVDAHVAVAVGFDLSC